MTEKRRLEGIKQACKSLAELPVEDYGLVNVRAIYNSMGWLINRVEELESENRKLKAFYDYFAELYGKGLEVDNWHGNGDLEPFDNFFEGAEEEMEDVE